MTFESQEDFERRLRAFFLAHMPGMIRIRHSGGEFYRGELKWPMEIVGPDGDTAWELMEERTGSIGAWAQYAGDVRVNTDRL